MHFLRRRSLFLEHRFPVGAATTTLLATLVGATFMAGCENHDLGKPCGTDPLPIPEEAIDSETPVIEVVRMQRDGACETFQCLAHRGLSPYCTKACEANSDCPVGFICEEVQETGPLVGKRYCVFERGCSRNIDCGSLGEIRCAKMGCLDRCALEPAGCTFHQLVCEERSDLSCECLPDALGNPRDTCEDADLVCTPTTLGTALPAGSVAQLNVCVPTNE